MDWFTGIVFLAILGWNIFVKLKAWKANRDAPVRSSMAKVISRRVKRQFKRHSMDVTRHVSFQMENGQSLELVVSQEDYDRLGEGDHGRLRYKGTQYIDFQKDME